MLSWGREEVVDGGGEREGNERDAGLRRFSPDNPGETTALSLSERPSLQKKIWRGACLHIGYVLYTMKDMNSETNILCTSVGNLLQSESILVL